MTKKTIIFGCFFFFLIPASAQIQSGKITYQYRLNTDKYLKANKRKVKLAKTLDAMNNSILNSQDKLKFELEFNKTRSHFYMQNTLNSDADKSMDYAIILTEAKNGYFFDRQSNTKWTSLEGLGERFIIKEKNQPQQWKTTNVSRKIGKYVCYKATAIKVTKNTKGIFKKEVIAWYTPQISFNYGPKGYEGLPGLILALEEGKLEYYATKIELYANKELTIKKPTKGRVFSRKGFDKMVSQLSKRRKSKH